MQATQPAATAVLTGMTLAVVRMSAMIDFYESVFTAQFQPVEAYGAMMFRGRFAGMDLMLCPQEVVGIKCDQNRVTLKFGVHDMQEMMDIAMRSGGSLLGAPTQNSQIWTVAVRDPDGNSIEFEQHI
jgi:predicted enzyme related to lactoylglutathione lyase